ncbi:MAG: class I SAM-dependent methyltransferase [Rickettsiales bacterium]|nr:class I SAM-dependent methyltransferase [Rickettsiales bacterium]
MKYQIGEIVKSDEECFICGSHEVRIVANKGRHFQKLTTAICTGCGMVHSHPIPSEDELKNYYKKQYRSDYKSAYQPKKKHIIRYSKNALHRLERLKQFTNEKSKLLDIGSGSGEFLYAAQIAGFDVTGIEPHEGYSKYTKDTFGVNVINSMFQDANVENESYDIITLHHVLEHLQKPLTALASISKWLKFDGILVIDVPDIEHTSHSPTNRFHYAHIYNFNYETLKALLTKAGFEVISHPSNQAGTILAAKKVREADFNMQISMPENYAKLWQLFSEGFKAKNYKKKNRLVRMYNKLVRYTKEFFVGLFLDDRKNIVEKELQKLAV